MFTRVFYPKARIDWLMTLGNDLGGPERAQAMVKGQGISLILKSLSIKFKRPVTYPDTVSDFTGSVPNVKVDTLGSAPHGAQTAPPRIGISPAVPFRLPSDDVLVFTTGRRGGVR